MSDNQFPALGFDPARGNIGTVRELARQMSDTGTYAKEAHEVIKSVQDKKDTWTGEAANAFTGKLDELPKYLEDGSTSLTDAGKALAEWADHLDAHQKRARELETEAKAALQSAEQADQAAQQANAKASTQYAYDPNNQTSMAAAQRQVEADSAAAEQANAAATTAWDRVEDIRRQARDLRDRWEDDASHCEDKLDEAAEKAPSRSFFESIDEFFDDPGRWFKDHLGDIGDIAGIVSAVAGALAFIPVLTPVMGPIAIGAGAVALAAHGADMVVNEKWDDHNAWISLVGDVAGLVPGVGAISDGFQAGMKVAAGADTALDATRMINITTDALTQGGRAFADEAARLSSKPSIASQWLAEKAMGVNPLLRIGELEAMTNNVAKVFQGGTNVALQIPTTLGLFTTESDAIDAKNTSGLTAGILNFINAKD